MEEAMAELQKEVQSLKQELRKQKMAATDSARASDVPAVSGLQKAVEELKVQLRRERAAREKQDAALRTMWNEVTTTMMCAFMCVCVYTYIHTHTQCSCTILHCCYVERGAAS
jgi:hypothetical protein